MKKILTVLAAAIALAGSAVLVIPAASALASVCQGNGTGCTKAGTYNESAVINGNYGGVFKVVWVKSVVAKYASGGIPGKWTAYVKYTNISSSNQTLTCRSSSSNSLLENLSGGSGDTGGSVPASYSFCSQNPGWTKNVPPGGYSIDWATFGNVPWPGTSVSLTWGPVGTSPNIYPFGAWDTDWAGSGFCHRSWKYAANGAPYIGITYNGVAVCGRADTGSTSNDQGPIFYTTPAGNTVYFDNGPEPGVGFQCVELAARYFYFQTTHVPPASSTGSVVVRDLGNHGYAVYPASGPPNGGTTKFRSSLKAGNIISMWSSGDPGGAGHVAVITYVSVDSSGNGYIDLIDENASSTVLPDGKGNDRITVRNGAMSYYNLYNKFQWTTNLPGT